MMEIFTFYLLDAKENTLANKGISGTATLQTSNGNTTQKKMEMEGAEAFTIMADGSNNYINLIVNFTNGLESISTKFSLAEKEENSHGDHEHNH